MRKRKLAVSAGSSHPNRTKHTRAWCERYPEKSRAQRIIVNDIYQSKLVRHPFCQLCLSSKRIEAHHTDYSKPREVVWLCHACHRSVEGRDAKNPIYIARVERERKQGGVRK